MPDSTPPVLPGFDLSPFTGPVPPVAPPDAKAVEDAIVKAIRARGAR